MFNVGLGSTGYYKNPVSNDIFILSNSFPCPPKDGSVIIGPNTAAGDGNDADNQLVLNYATHSNAAKTFDPATQHYFTIAV